MTDQTSSAADWTALGEECLQVLEAEEKVLHETRAHVQSLSTDGLQNLEALAATQSRQETLQRETNAQREARWAFQNKLADQLGIPPQDVRLSRILPHIPRPLRGPVSERLRGVRQQAEATQREVQRSRGRLLDLQMLVTDVLTTAVEGPAASARYSESGGPTGSPHVPLLKVRS